MVTINLGPGRQTQSLESQRQKLSSRGQIRDVTVDDLENSR